MRIDKFAGVAAYSANAMLMLVAIQRLPYSFYENLRSYTLVLCVVGVSCLWAQGKRWEVVPTAIVALIFNPIDPFHFARADWAGLNLAATVALGFSAYMCFSAKRLGTP